jgi:hypothetical protein
MKNLSQKFAAAALLPFVALQVHAAPLAAIDVSDATGTINNQIGPITLIATSVLGISFVVLAFRLVKRAAS